MARGGTVYILTNKTKTTLYVGVTSGIIAIIQEHQNKVYLKSFSARYNLRLPIYMEHFHSIEEAISREKYIKGKSRKWKEKLINQANPNWNDLSSEVLGW